MKKLSVLLMVLLGFHLSADVMVIDSKIVIDDDELEKIVKKVIRENPQLILDTINSHSRMQRMKRDTKVLEASFKNRIHDLSVSSLTPVRGPEDAPITLFSFMDFECPYCQKSDLIFKELQKKYPGKFKIVFKNNPLKLHKNAGPAAKAALAAANQGKFWEYYGLLFANSRRINDKLLVKLAEQLKLDIETFQTDRKSKEIADRIIADQAEAEKNKLIGTPVFVANGVVIKGLKSNFYFEKVFDRLIAEKTKTPEKASKTPTK